jgi:glyoxylate carboligase
MNVAEALAKLLKAYGAEYVFTLTGAPQEPLVAMHNREGVKIVLGRSERSVLAMADAYARLTGKPSFGIVQFGPGATYLPASLIDAAWAKSPLIGISGATTTGTRYRYEYQEADQTPILAPMTKWAGDLPAPARLPDVFRTAVRAAVSGCPGPAYLGIPADMFLRPIEGNPAIYADAPFTRVAAIRPEPGSSDVDRAIAALSGAARPVILAGGGVLISEAWDELTRLAQGGERRARRVRYVPRRRHAAGVDDDRHLHRAAANRAHRAYRHRSRRAGAGLPRGGVDRRRRQGGARPPDRRGGEREARPAPAALGQLDGQGAIHGRRLAHGLPAPVRRDDGRGQDQPAPRHPAARRMPRR